MMHREAIDKDKIFGWKLRICRNEQLRPDEAYALLDSLEAENRKLREMLMNCVNQACFVNSVATHHILDDYGSDTYREALGLLEELGQAEKLPGRHWRLKWPKGR